MSNADTRQLTASEADKWRQFEAAIESLVKASDAARLRLENAAIAAEHARAYMPGAWPFAELIPAIKVKHARSQQLTEKLIKLSIMARQNKIGLKFGEGGDFDLVSSEPSPLQITREELAEFTGGELSGDLGLAPVVWLAGIVVLVIGALVTVSALTTYNKKLELALAGELSKADALFCRDTGSPACRAWQSTRGQQYAKNESLIDSLKSGAKQGLGIGIAVALALAGWALYKRLGGTRGA